MDFVNGKLPASCCPSTNEMMCTSSNNAFTKGCLEELQSQLKMNANLLIGVGTGVAFIEVTKIYIIIILSMVNFS